VPAAEADAASALDAAHHADERWFGTPAAVAALVDVYVEQDRLSDAERLIATHGWASDLADTVPLRLLLFTRGRLRLALGQPHAALRDFLEHVRREQQLRALSAHFAPSHAGVALALAATGQVEAARVHATQALESARAWGAPRVVARALRVQASLEPPDTAAATLDHAARLLEPSPARVDEAWARLELGNVLVRLGRRDDGAHQLRAALDLASRAHALAVSEAARAALLSSGHRPRRAAASGVDALTGAERRVVELAARGLPNRSIAESLFVTERTVELHLTNAYRKLEVSTRRELASALERGSS
jgi:DNA-binding NarL/FixJ family response regulator